MRLIFNIMFVAQLFSTKHLRGYVNHTVTPTATLLVYDTEDGPKEYEITGGVLPMGNRQ